MYVCHPEDSILHTSGHFFYLPRIFIKQTSRCSQSNVLAFSITFSLRGTSTSASRHYLSSDQTTRRIELHHFPSSTPQPPLSHITGSCVLKAPSLIVFSIFVFPSFPAINCCVCGLGFRHVYPYLSTLTRSNTEYGKYAMQVFIPFLPAGT